AGLGKWWAVALFSVFIPVAHFVLVPSFLAYGAWQFFQRLGTVELATEARGTCPDCGAEQALELAPRWRAPQPVTCRQCHRARRAGSRASQAASALPNAGATDGHTPPHATSSESIEVK